MHCATGSLLNGSASEVDTNNIKYVHQF